MGIQWEMYTYWAPFFVAVLPRKGSAAMTKKQKTAFIAKLAKAVKKYAPDFGITCYSVPIAQGILESGWGESRLAKEFFNIHGLKCGTLWRGKSVDMATQEEFAPGEVTNITDNFRVYDSFEDGVRGYFEFLGLARYQNLKGVTGPKEYAETIKADGYATDSSYVPSLLSLVEEWDLTQYDPISKKDPKEPAPIVEKDPKELEPIVKETSERTREAYLDVFRGWLGYSEANGKFREILDIYNSHAPLARGYRIQESDEWCDCTVSAAAIKAGMVDLIGTEVGVERHVDIFKEKGIWTEDGAITPQPGDIIVFSWRKNAQPNDEYSSHIGVVEKVVNGTIHTIEGNSSEQVARRTYAVGDGRIRGFARPKYDAAPLLGGADAKTALEKQTFEKADDTKGASSKTPQYAAKVTCGALNVRSGPGKEFSNIKSWPILKRGNLVDVIRIEESTTGSLWAYIRIDGRIFGFVSCEFIERV